MSDDMQVLLFAVVIVGVLSAVWAAFFILSGCVSAYHWWCVA